METSTGLRRMVAIDVFLLYSGVISDTLIR